MGKPIVTYFPFRGLGETVRLALAAKGIDFENESVDMAQVKSDLDTYSFAQSPRFRDGDIDLVQSNAILRYLGRKHGLYGSTPEEAARIDQLLDGMGDLKGKIVPLVYMDNLKNDAEAKKNYWDTHLDPSTATGPCRGAHMVFINNLVKKHSKGFMVGEQLSIADVYLFDLVDLHQGKYGEEFDKAYPDLVALKEKIGAVPSIAAYLQSPLRFSF